MDNRQQFPNYDYSTLEVAQNQHPEHAQATHGYAQGGYPQQTYQTDPKLYAPQPYEGYNLPQVVDESYPEVTPPKPEVQNAPKGDYAAYGEHQGGVLAPQERRIWGLKRKTFFIVLGLVLLVVVGAVVGGAVGATAGKNSVKTGGTGDPGTGDDTGGGGGGGNGSSPGTVNNSPVLASSKLAAINWTDSSAVEYNAVFWQAKTDGLMMSLWDSKGKAWELVNITDKMVDVNIPGDPGATALKAKPGTALAAAVRGYPWTSSQFKGKAVGGDFTIALFYMNPVNNIVEIVSGDPRGASWGLGDLTSGQNDMKAAPDSQLSVWWSLCETNCSGTALLFYESTDQALKMANSSDWNTQSVILNIVSGSSLTATSCAPSWGQYGSSAQGLRVYYDASDVLSELMWNGYEKTWYYGTGIATKLPDGPPQIAATGFYNLAAPEDGPINLLVVGAFANGSAFGSYWDNRTWHKAAEPIMQGKVIQNFTAVSVFESESIRFFGLTNESEIHSYTVDRASPLSWTHDEAVKTS